MIQEIERKIDALFQGEKPISDDSASYLIQRVMDNLADTEKRFYKRFFRMIVIWLLSLGIHIGFFSEAAVVAFKIKTLQGLLLVSPLAVSFLLYGCFTAVCGYVLNYGALDRAFGHAHPSIAHRGLTNLLVPPTFLAIERLIGTNIITNTRMGAPLRRAYDLWWQALILVFALCSFAALIHTLYMMFASSGWPLWLTIPVLVVSLLPVVKGVLLAYTAIIYPYQPKP